MAVKKIFVRPGTMLDIHVVTNPDETLDNMGWKYQTRPQKVLVTIHDARVIEVHGDDVNTYGGRQCGKTRPQEAEK